MDRRTPPSGLARILVFVLLGEALGVLLAVSLLLAGFGLRAGLAALACCSGLGFVLAATLNMMPTGPIGRVPASPLPTDNKNGM